LGIDTSNYKPLALTEDQQIRNYMSKNYVDGSDIGNNTPFVWEPQTKETETKDNDDLDAPQ